MTAYLIAGTELNKVYSEETASVRVVTYDKEGNPHVTDKEVTRCFIGNTEITEFKEGTIPGTNNRPNLNYQMINSYLLSKGIELTVDWYHVGIELESLESESIDLDIEAYTKALNKIKYQFIKLGITENARLILSDY